MPRLNSDDIMRLSELIKSGASMCATARELNCSFETVSGHVARLGLPYSKPPQPGRKSLIPSSAQREMFDMYLSGKTLDEIADHVGQSRKVVTSAIRRMGGSIKRRGKYERVVSGADKQAIVQAWMDGATLQQIGSSQGMSTVAVGRILRESGIVTRRGRRGRRNATWRPQKRLNVYGYVRIKLHPDDPLYCMCTEKNYALEHRVVMARALGRSLYDYETVHHINGNRSDNRLENLQLRIGKHGIGMAMRCACCGSHNLEPVPLAEATLTFTAA